MIHASFTRAVLAMLLLYGAMSIGLVAQSKTGDPEVVFNTQSLIYHRASCTSARRCTKNCVTIRLSEAQKRGGRACRICGGPASAAHGAISHSEAVGLPAHFSAHSPGLIRPGSARPHNDFSRTLNAR